MSHPLLRLLRPGDWTKNLFVLPAFIFSMPAAIAGHADVAGRAMHTGVAFAAFCLMASGWYAFNDVRDVARDRLHPVKRNRPVACGQIGATTAMLAAVLCWSASIGVALTVNRMLVAILLAYALLQFSYNLGIKRVKLIDVVALATGFALRAGAGAVAINVQLSIWLALCVFFLCLFLGFIKRLCDLTSAEKSGQSQWTSPAGYDDRLELNWLLGISAVLAVVTYLMYATSAHAWSLFGSRSIGLALLSPLVLISVHRFYVKASSGESDSPLVALRTDRIVLITVLLFAAGVASVLYVPAVRAALERVFIVTDGSLRAGTEP